MKVLVLSWISTVKERLYYKPSQNCKNRRSPRNGTAVSSDLVVAKSTPEVSYNSETRMVGEYGKIRYEWACSVSLAPDLKAILEQEAAKRTNMDGQISYCVHRHVG